MAGRPGKIQPVFNSGEIGPRFDQRTSLKYHSGGLKHAQGVELLPQGGFTVSPRLRRVGGTHVQASRVIPFAANNGNVYDLVFTPTVVEVWGTAAQGKLHQFAHPYTASQLRTIKATQRLDTLVTFHPDVPPWRVLHGGPTIWVTGNAPLEDIPTYDYGGPIGGGSYTNGTASKFEIEFIGFNTGDPPLWADIVFTLSLNGQETTGIRGATITELADNVETALLALPNANPGITTAVVGSLRISVEFAGALNLGDIWALSGRVVNKPDAAVLSNKVVVGVKPGEPVISAARGWPRCGVFYQQRLIIGGFKSLPNAWLASISGRPFDFDERLNTAEGSFLVVLDVAGGEAVEELIDNQYLLVMTTENNYWVAGSANGLLRTTPPKHVPFTDHGIAPGVPTVMNEGAALYVHKSADFVAEARYTDIDGNYTALDISLLGYHLVEDVIDIAVRRKAGRQSSNMAAVINADGTMRGIYLLREQELTGFSRLDTDGLFKACAVNNRNELTVIVERAVAGLPQRSVERQEDGLLLDGALSFTYLAPVTLVTGLAAHEGAEVWAIGDGHVMGPYTVEAGEIELELAVRTVTVGRWTPPRIETLPLARMIGPELWLQKKARVHSVELFIEDTTSLAVGANGGKVYEVNLERYGMAADAPVLTQGVSGLVTLRGFAGYVDEPTVVITQLRPGRLTVKSVIISATL